MGIEEVDSGWWDRAEKERTWWYPIAKTFITNRPVPRHVAFVMDGNRRYAKVNQLGNPLRGHEKGFEQMARILEWCQDIGVEEVTVYAFSIENFKRSEEEVGGLMKLAEEKFAKLLDERSKLEEKQISFRFFGDISLLSPKLRKLMAQIQLATENYTKGYANVCMPYTSRDEIARSFETIRQGKEKGLLEENDISEWLVSQCLDTRVSTDPDMLIRTSGEKRLSDFLLWQCAYSHVYFADVLWPEFSFWNLCKAVLSYQNHNGNVKEIESVQRPPAPSENEIASLSPFLNWVESTSRTRLQEYAAYVESS